MDVKLGIVGIKRGISYQSITEELYVHPHPGIKETRFSRDQVRRAVAGLERAGLIILQSKNLQLILNCPLATRHYSVQNKAAIEPPHYPTIEASDLNSINSNVPTENNKKAALALSLKAATPLKDNNYIYLLLAKFEKFWTLYPEKKSRRQAWEIFQQLNLDDILYETMMRSLAAQISCRETTQLQGLWVPPWKYPANWLSHQSWEDEITETSKIQEHNHAKHRKNIGINPATDRFWDEETTFDNAIVYDLEAHRSKQTNY